MLRGCQKKVVFLKNTGSQVFEEAYFVIKPEFEAISEYEIISEATKIANGCAEPQVRRKKKRWGFNLFLFSLGLFCGALTSCIVYLIWG
jgi:hypothetical protein